MKFVAENLRETEDVALDFVEGLEKESEAQIVCLKGELGAGKTAFTKLVAKKLGIKEQITSPTFVIFKTYQLKNSDFKTLFHIDAYRLKTEKELKDLGWDDFAKNPENLIFIEWPENVPEIIPKKAVIIEFEVLGDSKREINIIWPEEKAKKIRKKRG